MRRPPTIAVRAGLVTLGEVETAHGITADEFAEWDRLVEQHGTAGLRRTPVGLRRTG